MQCTTNVSISNGLWWFIEPNAKELSVICSVKWTDQYDMNDLKLESPFNIKRTRKVRFMAQRYQREHIQFNGFNGFVWRRQHININFVWIAERSVSELAKDRWTERAQSGGGEVKCIFRHYHISVDFPFVA